MTTTKRDDERQRHCEVEHLKPLASKEAKDRKPKFQPSGSKSASNEVKAHEDQASSKRLVEQPELLPERVHGA